jgi:hypothetical protein
MIFGKLKKVSGLDVPLVLPRPGGQVWVAYVKHPPNWLVLRLLLGTFGRENRKLRLKSFSKSLTTAS